MKLLATATLLGAALAALAGVVVGGAVGRGLAMGFLLGAAVTWALVAWQRGSLRRRPERVLEVTATAFGAKLLALVLLALCFRYVEPFAGAADWTAVVVAFPVAALLVGGLGAFELSRTLKGGAA